MGRFTEWGRHVNKYGHLQNGQGRKEGALRMGALDRSHRVLLIIVKPAFQTG